MIHVVMLITNIELDFEKSISISEGREISIFNVHNGHVIVFSLFQMQILKTPIIFRVIRSSSFLSALVPAKLRYYTCAMSFNV